MLSEATRSNNRVMFALLWESKKGDINKQGNKTGNTILHVAASMGKANIVGYLCEKGATINILNKNKMTPLCLAVRKGNVDATRCLLDNEVNIGYTFNNIMNKKYKFQSREGADFIQTLLDAGMPIDFKTKNGNTLMHIAAGINRTKIIDFLHKKDPTLVNSRNNKGCTPLHSAAGTANQAYNLLKAYDARKTIVNKNLQTPSQIRKKRKIDDTTPYYFENRDTPSTAYKGADAKRKKSNFTQSELNSKRTKLKYGNESSSNTGRFPIPDIPDSSSTPRFFKPTTKKEVNNKRNRNSESEEPRKKARKNDDESKGNFQNS